MCLLNWLVIKNPGDQKLEKPSKVIFSVKSRCYRPVIRALKEVFLSQIKQLLLIVTVDLNDNTLNFPEVKDLRGLASSSTQPESKIFCS